MAEKEYIERDALCYQLAKQATIDGQPRAIRRAAKIVADFPAADVRPVVRGKWESHGEGFKWVYICSACGYVDGYPLNDRMNFCPNCGADMRLDDETT